MKMQFEFDTNYDIEWVKKNDSSYCLAQLKSTNLIIGYYLITEISTFHEKTVTVVAGLGTKSTFYHKASNVTEFDIFNIDDLLQLIEENNKVVINTENKHTLESYIRKIIFPEILNSAFIKMFVSKQSNYNPNFMKGNQL